MIKIVKKVDGYNPEDLVEVKDYKTADELIKDGYYENDNIKIIDKNTEAVLAEGKDQVSAWFEDTLNRYRITYVKDVIVLREFKKMVITSEWGVL